MRTREELEELKVADLVEIAKDADVPLVGREKKADLIAVILAAQLPEGVEGEEDEPEIEPMPELARASVTYVFDIRAVQVSGSFDPFVRAVTSAGAKYRDDFKRGKAYVEVPEGVVLPEWVLLIPREVA